MTYSTVPMSRISLRLGMWAALFSALALIAYTVCFVAILAVNPLFIWTNWADYVAYRQAHPSVWPDLGRLTMFVFGPLFVLMLNTIYDLVPAEHRSLTRAGLCFGVAFAALTGAHYFVQLSAVRLNLLAGHLDGLEQVVQANPYSAMSAVNMLGWTFCLGLACLLVAPAFTGDGLEQVLRMAFGLNGLLCILGGIGYMLDNTLVVFLTINLGMGGALTVIGVALALWLRQADQSVTGSPCL